MIYPSEVESLPSRCSSILPLDAKSKQTNTLLAVLKITYCIYATLNPITANPKYHTLEWFDFEISV